MNGFLSGDMYWRMTDECSEALAKMLGDRVAMVAGSYWKLMMMMFIVMGLFKLYLAYQQHIRYLEFKSPQYLDHLKRNYLVGFLLVHANIVISKAIPAVAAIFRG